MKPLDNMCEDVDIKIDNVYDAIDALMKAECWTFLDDFFDNFCLRIWRTDVDILLAYATASLPAKSHIPSRERFIAECKRQHPHPELWKGLE